MSKELIRAAEIIKEECSKHDECKNCFYGCIKEGLQSCFLEVYINCPSIWDLYEWEEKND